MNADDPKLLASLVHVITADLQKRLGHYAQTARESGVSRVDFDVIISAAVVQVFALTVGSTLYKPGLTVAELVAELRRFPYDAAAAGALAILERVTEQR